MTENKNNKKPIIQSHGYNGSEPTRICPHCGKEKPISDFGFRNMGNEKIRNQSVGLSMMCYKHQKTSPLDKKENK